MKWINFNDFVRVWQNSRQERRKKSKIKNQKRIKHKLRNQTMQFHHPANRPLLADDYSNTSNDEDDDYFKNENDTCTTTTTNGGGTRSRHQFHRRTKRFTRFVIVFGALIIILLLIYIPLFNTIQSRLGMDVCIQNNSNSSCMHESEVVAISGWGYNTSRNVGDYVHPYRDTTLIEPISACHSNFFLLIVVCSSVNHFIARQAIRETWGNVTEFNYPHFNKMHRNLTGQYLDIQELNLRMNADYLNLSNVTNFNESSHQRNFPVRVVFLIGKSYSDKSEGNETIARLKLESEQYDDLIQEDFHDTYNNLTIKSIMMLKWVTKRCLSRTKYLMKCDDDTFVNVPNLLHILLGGTVPLYNSTVQFFDETSIKTMSPMNRLLLNQNLLMGYLFCLAKPVADIGSKWYSPIYMYSGDTYPNYLSGSSYLMSFDVIPKLYNASLHTSLFHLEDVYLTGICAERIRIHRRHHPLFMFGKSSNKCSYKGTITQHYQKGDLMRDAYNFLMNLTNRCPPPEKYFKVKRLRKRPKVCQ